MSILVVGVDVSRNTLDVALCINRKVVYLSKFANAPAGFGELADTLKAQAAAADDAMIQLIMEPTGGYELPLANFALEQGWQVSLPNPRQVRDWAKGGGRRGKTDRQDARMLAQYGYEQKPAAWRPLPEAVAVLEALLQRRSDLEGMLRQELNRRDTLQAQQAYGGAVAESLQRLIAYLQQAIQDIEDEIRKHLDQHPDLQAHARRLQTVPGVGPRSVLPLLVLLCRWSALTQNQGSRQGLTALVGLDPVPYESGTSVRKRSGISRAGNTRLRQLLYMAALGGTHGHNALRDFYQRLVAAGKAKKLALVAAARKILVWAWAVYRDQVEFIPAKAGRPEPEQATAVA